MISFVKKGVESLMGNKRPFEENLLVFMSMGSYFCIAGLESLICM